MGRAVLVPRRLLCFAVTKVLQLRRLLQSWAASCFLLLCIPSLKSLFKGHLLNKYLNDSINNKQNQIAFQ